MHIESRLHDTPRVSAATRFTWAGETMGTRYSAVFYADPTIDLPGLGASLQRAVDRVDDEMSTWKEHSLLSSINRQPCDVWLDVSPDLATVIAAGLAIGDASGGAFDIGVGDVTNAWGFGPAGRTPDRRRIAQLARNARRTATRCVELDRDTMRMKKLAPIHLDLSGIAKGFGVDVLARVLDAASVTDYLVSIDGEVRAGGLKPGPAAWTIAVESPVPDVREPAAVVELTDCAIATSGDYRRRVELDGVTSAHTMDPRVVRPVTNRVASVTVLAKECMQADAWATALMVLGEVEGPRIAERQRLDALFMVRTATGFWQIPVGRFRQAHTG